MAGPTAAARLFDAVGLDYSEHLIVWILRRLAGAEAPCGVMLHEFLRSCGRGAPDVLAAFGMLLAALGRSARHRIKVGSSSWGGRTGDERQIVAVIGAAQQGDMQRLDALLCWLALPRDHATLVRAAQCLAAALSAHGLLLSAREAEDLVAAPAWRGLRPVV